MSALNLYLGFVFARELQMYKPWPLFLLDFIHSDLAVNSKKWAEVKLRITLLYKQLLVAQLLFCVISSQYEQIG